MEHYQKLTFTGHARKIYLSSRDSSLEEVIKEAF